MLARRASGLIAWLVVSGCAELSAPSSAPTSQDGVAGGGAPGAAMPTEALRDDACELPLIFGHRGTLLAAPENTLEAYAWALEQGAEGIELDVRMSADGALVSVHDSTMERTTGGASRARVGDLTLAELRALDVGSWFDPAFAGARVPTLEEIFARFDDRGALYMLDVKDAAVVEPLVAEIERAGVALRVLFAAEDLAILTSLQARAPHVPALYWMSDMSELETLALPSLAYVRVPRGLDRDRSLAQEIVDAGFGAVVGGSKLQWQDAGGPATEIAISNNAEGAVARRERLRPPACARTTLEDGGIRTGSGATQEAR